LKGSFQQRRAGATREMECSKDCRTGIIQNPRIKDRLIVGQGITNIGLGVAWWKISLSRMAATTALCYDWRTCMMDGQGRRTSTVSPLHVQYDQKILTGPGIQWNVLSLKRARMSGPSTDTCRKPCVNDLISETYESYNKVEG
jgi:hypothetical protein